MNLDKEKYTTAEVAKVFEVENNTVRQWTSRGLINPLPDQKRIVRGKYTNVFSIDEIKRFANERYGNADV